MASFSLDYSSSEEDLEAQPSRFNIGDLPSLQIHLHSILILQILKVKVLLGPLDPKRLVHLYRLQALLVARSHILTFPLKLPTVQLRNPNLSVGESIPRRSRVLGKRDIRNRLAIFLSLTAPRSKCIRLNVRKVPCFPRCASLYL